MTEYSAKYGIKDIGSKYIRDMLNKFFADKKNLSQHVLSGNIYIYNYTEDIEEHYDIPLTVEVEVSDKDDSLLSIKISSVSDDITRYDLEHYCLKLYRYFTCFCVGTEEDGFKNYCIRVYKKILHFTDFEGKYEVNFLSCKIVFWSLFDDGIKNDPVEHIIAFDCNMKALSLESARSQAINVVTQLSAFLSPFLGIGFSDINSQYTHVIRTAGQSLATELEHVAFIDLTLGEGKELIVNDNMNGLISKKKYLTGEYNMPYFFSLRSQNEEGKTGGTIIDNNIKGMTEDLEDIFLGHRLEERKSNPREFYSEKIEDNIAFNVPLKIPRQIRQYVRQISEMYSRVNSNNRAKYQKFLGSCTLYNMAMIYGINEATLMISLMISSIEALAKIDGITFQQFMKKYLGEENYDKKFCDFLYGTVRSGFFHSGETYFREYECSLDISLLSDYEKRHDDFTSALLLLRRAFIEWISQNLLSKDIRS